MRGCCLSRAVARHRRETPTGRVNEEWLGHVAKGGRLGPNVQCGEGAAAGDFISSGLSLPPPPFPPRQSYVPEPFQELVGGSATPSVASLHLIGQADDLVPPAASMAAAKTLTHAQARHNLGAWKTPSPPSPTSG